MDVDFLPTETFQFPEVITRIRHTNDAIAAGHASNQLSARIELEIAELEAAALRLRASRNACQPLLRLPSEILGEIAEILTVVWPADNGHSIFDDIEGRSQTHPSWAQLGWVLLGHVCQRLRRVVLSRHDLWANNICTISRCPANVISYCCSAPLRISISKTYKPAGGFRPQATQWIDCITQHSGFLRSILIRQYGSWADDTLFANLDPALFSISPFPHLTQLTLSLTTYPRENVAALTADILEMPEMVAPKLRSLCLTNYLLPFNPSTITSLTLEFRTPTYLHTPLMFRDILRRCSRLRSLNLAGCIPLLPTNDIEAISLPCVEDVRIRDAVHRCIGLLANITTPSPTSYRVDCTDVDLEYPGSVAFIDDISPYLQMRVSTPITGLAVEFGDLSRECGFSLYQRDMPANLSIGPGDPLGKDYREQIRCSFTKISLGAEQSVRLMPSLLNTFNLTAIETLEVAWARSDDSTVFWTATFQRFPYLTTLHFTSISIAGAAALVAPDSGQDVVLPRLRHLYLDTFASDEPDDHDILDVPDQSQFIRMLSSRLRAGKQLEHLYINHLLVKSVAQARRKFIPRLKALVPFVEVGKVQAMEDLLNGTGSG